ncbi:MAG TPA: glutaredoxin domain-containing protein [Candidatus Cloacimonadota bacterium]|nr:glutaredoxin domain-containing protein [Candidatus Cloacimonadota bacterium]HQL13593.1 glutaredoxin domain-containing protein [Candidatus Cloacimonadota bacterium]HQP17685.1 glutaredoxin domain-containing protein [Candidatus Cloacimonadota bacterium]
MQKKVVAMFSPVSGYRILDSPKTGKKFFKERCSISLLALSRKNTRVWKVFLAFHKRLIIIIIRGRKNMNKNIVVFGTPTCSWCTKVKDYLKSKGYQYKYVDVSQDARALDVMQRKTGQMGVPQVWINNTAVVGFDRVKIDQLLQRK